MIYFSIVASLLSCLNCVLFTIFTFLATSGDKYYLGDFLISNHLRILIILILILTCIFCFWTSAIIRSFKQSKYDRLPFSLIYSILLGLYSVIFILVLRHWIYKAVPMYKFIICIDLINTICYYTCWMIILFCCCYRCCWIITLIRRHFNFHIIVILGVI